MEIKTLNIFYGADCLPYKDSAREIHFPLVGNTFIGANNTTQIRFYVDRIGGVDSVTWLVVSKLPNGQIGNEVLNSNNAVYDEELGEHYIELSLSSYYTTLKGDVYLSLNGYQGGVEVEQDEDTGVYSIYGTPTIQATGVVKIGINYAPQVIPGSHFNTSDLQQILGALSEKPNISNVILVLASQPSDLSDYENGQIFYVKNEKEYYINNNGVLSSFDIGYQKAKTLVGTETISNLVLYSINNWGIGRYNDNLLFLKVKLSITPTPHIEYAIYQLSNEGVIKSWINNNATGTETIASIVSSTPTNEYATKNYVNNNVDYLKSISTAFYPNLLSATSTLDTFYSLINAYSAGDGSPIVVNFSNLVAVGNFSAICQVWKSGSTYTFIFTPLYAPTPMFAPQRWNKRYQGQSVSGSVTINDIFANNSIYEQVFATKSYVDEEIASFKENEINVVNTTTYPTLNDFLASTGTEGYIYLYPIDTTDLTKGYYRYVWEDNAWLALGTTEIDLTDYYTKSQVDTLLNGKVDKTQTIAGIALSGNVSAQDLTDALVFMNTTTDLDYVMGE